MLFPSFPQVVDAADWQPGVEQKPASDASVSISLPASIDFSSVTPTPDGATTTATADLTVTTTNSAATVFIFILLTAITASDPKFLPFPTSPKSTLPQEMLA